MDFVIFAAIEVGSSELSMKIYEVAKEKGIKQLEYIRKPIELGAETYVNNKISHNIIKIMCKILNEFKRKMKEYGVCEYRAFATSAIREATNSITVLDRIKITTGIDVKVLSNSEKRFLYYKAIVMRDKEFNDIIGEGAAIVDVGAGSIQISLYDNGLLVSTQNIKLGFIRIEKLLFELGYKTNKYNKLIEEYVSNDLSTYKRIFLEKKSIKNIIVVGDNINDFSTLCLSDNENDYLSKEEYYNVYNDIINSSEKNMVEDVSLIDEQTEFIAPTAIIYKKVFDMIKAEKMWFPQVQVNDGLAVDYAENHNFIKMMHDFNSDIVSVARKLGQRYKSNTKHVENVEYIALQLYDRLNKIHGLGKRERLYTQIAAIMHNCGTFININDVPINSYNIVMSTEMIGLSHSERELVANLVKYISYELPNYSTFASIFDIETYISMTKIIAILRIANAMDKSHKQKCKKIDIEIVENSLIITVDSIVDISLEKKVFSKEVDFFIEVYGIKPKLKQKHKK